MKKTPEKKNTKVAAPKAASKKVSKPVESSARDLKASIYNTKGAEAGSVSLPESVFAQKWNADLVHEVVTSMMANARTSTADTKGRGEVRGGGKKPWKQKGTGRARHGSRRSPIWRGGGVTHGPLAEKLYTKKINRNARAKALAVTLSKKYEDGEVIFVNAFSFEAPKTKEARGMIDALSAIKGAESLKGKRKNAALIVLAEKNPNTEKSFANFGNIAVTLARDVNPVEVMTYKFVVIAQPDASLEALTVRVAGRKGPKKSVVK